MWRSRRDGGGEASDTCVGTPYSTASHILGLPRIVVDGVEDLCRRSLQPRINSVEHLVRDGSALRNVEIKVACARS